MIQTFEAMRYLQAMYYDFHLCNTRRYLQC